MTRKTSKSEKKEKPDNATKAKQIVYSEELAIQICEAIASSTDSLEKVCRENPHFPTRKTIQMWKFRHPEFMAMYMCAKDAQSEAYVEEIFEILKGDLSTKELIMAATLQINTRKWTTCRVLPRLHGNKKELAGEVSSGEIAALTETISKLVKSYEREF